MSDTLRDQLLGLGFKPVPKPEKPARPPNEARRGPHSNAHPNAKPQGGRPDSSGANARPGAKPDGRADAQPNARPDARPGAKPGTHPGNRPARPSGGRPQQNAGAQQQRKPRSQDEIDLAKAYAIRAQREKEERIEAERVKQEEARVRREAKVKFAELVKDKGLNDPAADIARHFEYGNKIKRIYVNEAQLKQLNAGELGVVQLDGRYMLVTAELLAQAETVFQQAVALKVDPNATAEEDPYADPQYRVPDDLVW